MSTALQYDVEELRKLFKYENGKLFRLISDDNKQFPEYRGKFKEVILNRSNDGSGYVRVGLPSAIGRYIRAHRLIYMLVHGPIDPTMVIDHIDGNRLNNDINNLRVVDTRTNVSNRQCHREGKLPGCCWVPRDGAWRATCWVNNKRYSLGYYKTEIEAYEAYQKALKSFSLTNAPKEEEHAYNS